MRKVVVFGTAKFAEVLDTYSRMKSDFEIVAFTEDNPKSKIFLGKPVIDFSVVEKIYPPRKFDMMIAIGHTGMNSVRESKFKEAKKKGYDLPAVIMKGCINIPSDVDLDEGCCVFEAQVFQQNVTVGKNTVIWSGNHFGHDVKIGSNVFISSHVVLSGDVEVGDNTFIGVNATIGNGVKIGKRNLIGAGALILKDTNDDEVYVVQQTPKCKLTSMNFVNMFNRCKMEEI